MSLSFYFDYNVWFFISHGQYTDQINSNRPGASIGAFSVGKNVVQFEGAVK